MKLSSCKSYVLIVFLIFLTASLFGQHNYYVSSINGNDANSGTSAGSAWRTLTKLQTVIPSLHQGDKIFLHRGSVWYNVHLEFSNINGTSSAPIIIDAYGSGPEPVLSGGVLVTGFQQNGSLWNKTDAAFPDITDEMKIVAGLYINNQLYLTGRTPNSGFYSTTTQGTTTYLEDNEVNWSENQWQGGQLVARTVSWAYDKSYITSSDAHSYNLEGLYYTLQKEETFYFLQNHINALDLNYEWCYDNHTLTVYSTSDLNQQKVELPVAEKLVELTDCDYIHFKNLHFTKANLTGVEVNQSNYIEIRNCKISNIGSDGVKVTESSNFKFEDCQVFDCFSNAIKLDFPGITTIQNNHFKRIGIFPGAPNGNIRVGATITSYIAQQSVTVQHNRYDSVRMAYQGHWSACPMYFQYNVIEDYGMILGDIGAVYLEGEAYGQYVKYVKNNIFINGHSDLDSYYERGTSAYAHAIYLDYDCSNVLIDSNTIITCNLGILFNRVRRNTIQHNNIFNPGEHMVEGWRSAIAWDGNSGVTFETLDFNNFINNQVVIDDDPDAKGFLMHNAPVLGNTMDYNTYIIPFRNDLDIIKTVQDYADFTDYTLTEWYNASGQEGHSTYGHSSTHYSTALGVSKEEFVKVYYNPTRNTIYQPLGAKYVDRNGVVYDRGLYIPPYYSKVLFYNGVTNYPNQYPTIQPQSFYIEEQNPLPPYVGKVIASDPDPGQILTYAITSGNDGNIFHIDPSTGDLYLNVTYLDFQNIESIPLTIRVTDNGIPSLSRSATITIYLTQDPVNYPPVINDQQFLVEYQYELPSFIGQVIANDPNMGQTLTYSIISGNASGYFVLLATSGNLYFHSSVNEIPDGNYTLVVRVTDDGSPALYSEAAVTVTVNREIVNLPPLIENQAFRFFDVQDAGTYIGKVVASDPDGDDLSFEILSGDEELVVIDTSTGELSFNSEGPLFESNHVIELIVQVSDNGAPVESTSAFIEIQIIAGENIVYIDPSMSGQGTGLFENPFNSFEGINFESGHVYLLKKGTSTVLDNPITINSSDILISTYGEGEKPVVRSDTYNYLFTSTDQSFVSIEGIHFDGDYALSCVYFLGPLSEEIVLRNCIFEGSDYGIRLINTGEVLIEHCEIRDNSEGIFGIARKLKVHYNIFTGNETAVKLVTTDETCNLYNNVFFNNERALISSAEGISLYNNIFSLVDPSHRAVDAQNVLFSDFNIYYPVQNGFFSLGGDVYNSLEEIRETFEMELNSFDEDPEFVDAFNGNFNLGSNSPAIDAGTYLGLIYDINGNTVPYGIAPDIGAMEQNDIQTGFSGFTSDPLHINVFPNPANISITVQMIAPSDSDYRLQLIDSNGRIISENLFPITQGIHEISLNITPLPKGIYLIRVISEKESVIRKFIKN